ncbi:MAG: hypothetical protein V7696_06695 [Halioglobus sp.]
MALTTSLVGSQFLSGAAMAQETEGEWEFQLAPLFLWGMSINGESSIDGNVAPMDLDFKDDLLENMDGVFTLHFEARKQDLVLFAEYQYVSVNPDVEAAIGPVTVNADIDFSVNSAELGGGYTISQSDSTRWEVLGGLRWQDHDLDVDVEGPDFLPSNIKGGDDWYHGFLGGRVTTELGKNWSFIARGDYGYGGSDNDVLHLSMMADYRFKSWGSAFIGYRYMKYDYASSNYSYDAEQQGPQLGMVIYW